MVRTKDNAGVKVGAKAPRKGLSGPSTSASPSTSSKKPREDSGGNPVCPRETPAWQKPITDFFRQQTASKTEEDASSKENVNPEGNRDFKSKESTESKPDQDVEPRVEKSDEGNPESAGPSKE